MSVLEIELKNAAQLDYVVELLRSLKFVEAVRVRPESEVEKVVASDAPSWFDKYNGRMAHLDTDAFERYLTETRDEWEQPRF